MKKFYWSVMTCAPLIAVVIFAAQGARADIIDRTNGAQLRGVTVKSDTLSRLTWENRETKVSETPYQWDIVGIKLMRRNLEIEDTLNKALKAGTGESWARAETDIPKALVAHQALEAKLKSELGDIEWFRLRLMAYAVRAKVELGKDPTAEYAEFVAANRAYAEKLAKSQPAIDTTGKLIAAGEYKGLDVGTLHSATFEAMMAMGRYHASKGNPDEAYDKAYQPLADMCSTLARARNVDGFLVHMAIPAYRAGVNAFTTAAKPQWEKAAKILSESIERAYGAMNDQLGVRKTRLEAARCYINVPGKEGSAASVYEDVVKEYESSVSETQAPPEGWLTPDLASYYASAYLGLGLASATQKGSEVEALRFFSRSLALFSADQEIRAEAALHAGLITVKIAEKGKKDAAFYFLSAQSYYLELTINLNDTVAFARASELADALARIKPKA